MLSQLLTTLSNEPDTNIRLALMESWIDDNPDTLTKEELDDVFYQHLVDVTRQKLLVIRNTTNVFKAASLKTDLVNWLRIFVNDKQDVQKLVEVYSSEIKETETYTLRQLRELSLGYKDYYLVQGLIRKNILLLIVGAPKTGKSLFVTNLIVRLIQGEPFLNRTTSKSKVLFLQNEENVISTYKRVYNNGLQYLEAKEPALFEELLDSESLVVAKHLDLVVDKNTIFKLLEDSQADVLVVDSLGASIRKSGLTEYSPELATVLYEWQDLAHSKNVTVLVLHHSTKMDSTDSKSGMIKGVAGTNALVRANDGLFKLHPSKKAGIVDLFTIPRDGTPEELELRYTEGEASFWTFEVEKEKTLSPENVQLQNSIMRLLMEQYNIWKANATDEDEDVYGYTLTELVDILAVPRTDLIKRLNNMCETEGIARRIHDRKFIYSLPASGESWLIAYLEAEQEEVRKAEERKQIDIKMAEKVKNTKTKEEFIELIKGWTDEEKKRVFALLDSATKLEKQLLVTPPKYPINSQVMIEDIVVTVLSVQIKEGKHMYTVRDDSGNTFCDYIEEQLKPV